MSLMRGKANPLNFLGMRKLERMPPNFTKFTIAEMVDSKMVDRWIYQFLDQRYCIRKTTALDSQGKMATRIEVGFEDPRELTMFTLSCPYLQKIGD